MNIDTIFRSAARYVAVTALCRLPFSVSTNAKPARWFRSFLSRPHQSRKYAAVAQSIDVRRLLRERGQYGRPGVLNSNPGQSPDRPGLAARVRLHTANTGRKLKPA